ncbi:DEAD/DEAH box helicase [Candidatus Woesearchaeota archaeon]|nr:DEAD/DEAH box helicase [Candidatus Woesearchaeota archaeon]
MISGIHFHPELKRVFEELGFLELTDIQKKTIPLIQQGKDVIGQSKTGSGKTAAFGFPILEKLTHNNGLQALILVPTRELCEQVMTEMRKFAKYKRMNIIAVYGGVSINPQIHDLRHADIVVATPGRMLDHAERGTIQFSRVKILVLDEADKMFEMGFIDDVKRIISQIPKDRQTLLFSATISQHVHDIVKHYMKQPEKIKVQEYVEEAKLAQHFYSVNSRDKFSLLVHLLKTQAPGLTIIFCATRNRVDVVSKNLYKHGIRAQGLHGGLSQNRRKQAIDAFHHGKIDILVASDVAARGLDIKNVKHIINYDIPKTSKEYIHRIGRTARAGEAGKVISLLSEQDHDNFRSVLGDRSLVIEQLKLPEFQRIPFFASVREHHGFGRGFQRGGRFGFQRRSPYSHRREGSSGTGHHRKPYHSREEGSSESGERRGGYHRRRFR